MQEATGVKAPSEAPAADAAASDASPPEQGATSPAPRGTPPQQSDNNGDGISSGVLAAIIICSVALVALLVGLSLLLMAQRRHADRKPAKIDQFKIDDSVVASTKGSSSAAAVSPEQRYCNSDSIWKSLSGTEVRFSYFPYVIEVAVAFLV